MNSTANLQINSRNWAIVLPVLLGCASAMFLGILSMQHRDWLECFTIATIVSALSAIVSMLLLRRALRRGPDAIFAAFVGSSAIRSIISIGGCVAAIFLLHVAPAPTLLMMTIYYFAILSAETFIMVSGLKVFAQ